MGRPTVCGTVVVIDADAVSFGDVSSSAFESPGDCMRIMGGPHSGMTSYDTCPNTAGRRRAREARRLVENCILTKRCGFLSVYLNGRTR